MAPGTGRSLRRCYKLLAITKKPLLVKRAVFCLLILYTIGFICSSARAPILPHHYYGVSNALCYIGN